MSVISLILAIALVGVLLWAINRFLPMDSKVKGILNIVVIVVLILWLLKQFGILNFLGNVKV